MLLNKIQVNNGVKLDFIHIEGSESESGDIFEVNRYIPSLNSASKFFVTFDDLSLVAKGISESTSGYSFSVYKEEEGSNGLKFVAYIDGGKLFVSDYNIKNNIKYKYYIFREDASTISKAVLSNEIQPCWDSWSVIGLIPDKSDDRIYHVDKDNIWHFNLNLQSGTTAQNISKTVYQTLGKYPKISTGRSNYSSGSLSCLLGDVRKTNESLAEYIEPLSLLNQWRNFCADGCIKLLRDRKGNSYLVDITNTNSAISDIIREQPNTISFEWTEVEQTSDISIIEV